MTKKTHGSETFREYLRRRTRRYREKKYLFIALEESAKWIITVLLPFAFTIAALTVSYQWMHQPQSQPAEFPRQLFFRHLFLAGVVLQLLILGLRLSRPGLRYPRAVLIGFLISAAISVLLTADSWKTAQAPDSNARAIAGQSTEPGALPSVTERPDTFAKLLYVLIVERPALLGLSLFALGGIGAAIYYIFRLLMPVEYTGSGIQIRLPGQAVYYLPIYPQVRWQKTGIELREGERVSVDLYGWVSPGGLQGLKEWEDFTHKLVLYEKRKFFSDLVEKEEEAELKALPEDTWPTWEPTWPFTGPEGYPKKFYRKLGVLRKHPLYKHNDFYEKDVLLTVQGRPHSQVFGIVLSPSEEPPKSTGRGERAYNWNEPSDREQILCLSSEKYPLEIKSKKSGQLWVVVNDVDEARWDNVGLFFMKLTRRSWL